MPKQIIFQNKQKENMCVYISPHCVSKSSIEEHRKAVRATKFDLEKYICLPEHKQKEFAGKKVWINNSDKDGFYKKNPRRNGTILPISLDEFNELLNTHPEQAVRVVVYGTGRESEIRTMSVGRSGFIYIEDTENGGAKLAGLISISTTISKEVEIMEALMPNRRGKQPEFDEAFIY
ncbi:MAG: hypothetical protein KGH61_00405 [Candidatus Micrarchaeota archaeon]|nr:hypothetical protein [Candidatus Micrarchaeota archaeon]MDE1847398.1 hypothetical protein [Candidatus Micrarchaeota archaeon]MDE1864013.1 hypothetical protein [Candidatus Micrarchaeota archaeon]